MSKASATKLDPEAQAAPPPGSRRRRITGAAAFVGLVLLSLGELLLPLPDVCAGDARVEIGFDGARVFSLSLGDALKQRSRPDGGGVRGERSRTRTGATEATERARGGVRWRRVRASDGASIAGPRRNVDGQPGARRLRRQSQRFRRASRDSIGLGVV